MENPRGSTHCSRCRAALKFRTRYHVWFEALLTSYTGRLYGVTLGAQVIRWLPSMRPYRGRQESPDDEFYDTVFSITQLIYTLNDYGKRRLSPRWLPEELAYLKRNLKEPIAMRDPEMLGELLDTLKSFGLRDSDPLIRTGMEYLLATQNPDDSWGDMQSHDTYLRYHPTWTAIDGLRDYRW